MSRRKFTYKLYDSQGGCYGTTTDIYMLPVGTEFTVENGIWDGKIVEKDGKKYMHVISTDRFVKLTPDLDCGLVITIKSEE